MNLLRRSVLLFVLLWIAACQPTNSDLPTLVPKPTDIPTEAPTQTFTPTRTPAATSTPTPAPVIGRFATDPTKIGYLRVVHVAPDTAPIDVYVDQTTLASNIEYGLATGKTNILAGAYTIRVTRRGDASESATLASTPVQISVGQSIILVLGGLNNALSLTTVEESNEPLNDDESRVNFVHAVPLAPTVKGQLNGVDLSPLFDFGQQSGGIVVSAAAATLSFATSEQTLLNYPTTLEPRIHYTLILYGRSDALDSLSVLVFDNPVPGLATMRVINMLKDSVDVDLDNNPLVSNLAYASASERTPQAAGNHALSLYPAGGDRTSANALLQNFTFSDESGDNLSLILLGDASDPRVLVLMDDLSPILPDQGRITFINAMDGVDAARVGLNSSIIDELGAIAYGKASSVFPIYVGENRVFWQQVGGGIIEDVQNLLIESGRTYLYLLTGSIENPVVFSEPVPLLSEVVSLPTDILDTPTPRTRIRLVNAVEDLFPVDFTLNGQVLASSLVYSQGTDYIEITPGTLPMIIQQTGNPNVLTQRDLRIIDSGDFVVFIFGPSYDLSALVFPDDGLQFTTDQSVTLRLVNLSMDETVGFGLVATTATDPLTPDVTPAPSVPLGLRYLVNNVDYRSTSQPVIVQPVLVDLILSDNRTRTIGARLRSFQLEQGMNYDVVATYSMQTGVIRVFVLPRPRQ